MKIYLVGGAVRDKLLNYPSDENDWVVVGGTPQQMIDQGFEQVGKDFPVFLHPKTKEEYALARRERKTGPGYGGFSFSTEADVSLEDDLMRRDLTINAIALSDDGELIDPYNGAADIQSKILRHVSPAFSEDPVRILRVARFAARYHHLGFTIAPETLALMQAMVANGEVNHLVSERIWKEFSRALGEQTPHIFIQTLRDCQALKTIMPQLDKLFGIPQSPEHHPEIDTGIHTLMCLQQACKLSTSERVRFATLMHDLGKGDTESQFLPKHPGHEERGVELINNLCQSISAPNEYRDLSLLACRYHTQCHRALSLDASDIYSLFKSLDVYRKEERFEEFLLSCQADSLGRKGYENIDYPQADFLRAALNTTKSVEAKTLVAEGFKGALLGAELDRRRINMIANYKNSML
ncbi:Multifunctional CCA protein [Thalassocella blandensis]|nr:Multifunctional CCA protein [Thalassocella blandensis]